MKYISDNKNALQNMSNESPEALAGTLVQNLANSKITSLTSDLISSLFAVSDNQNFKSSLSKQLFSFVKDGFKSDADKNVKANFKDLSLYIELTPSFDQTQVENLFTYLFDNRVQFSYYNLLTIYLRLIPTDEEVETKTDAIANSLKSAIGSIFGKELSAVDKGLYYMYVASFFHLNISDLTRIYDGLSIDDSLSMCKSVYNNFAMSSLKNKTYSKSINNLFFLHLIKSIAQGTYADGLTDFCDAMLYDYADSKKQRDVGTILNSIEQSKQKISVYTASIQQRQQNKPIDLKQLEQQLEQEEPKTVQDQQTKDNTNPEIQKANSDFKSQNTIGQTVTQATKANFGISPLCKSKIALSTIGTLIGIAAITAAAIFSAGMVAIVAAAIYTATLAVTTCFKVVEATQEENGAFSHYPTVQIFTNQPVEPEIEVSVIGKAKNIEVKNNGQPILNYTESLEQK